MSRKKVVQTGKEMASTRCNAKDVLRRKIPIVAWLPEYSWTKLFQDSLAGLTVGLTAIPQGIAYAIVAGLPPQYGLYSSFMGSFVYVIFGSTKDVTIGPTAITAVLTQPHVVKYGPDFAVLLCFLSGCVSTAIGLLRLGFLIDFISMPVICGFTNAAAIMIASSQLSSLFGISSGSNTFLDSVINFFKKITDVRPWDTLLGFVSIAFLVGLKNLPGRRAGTALQKCMWLVSLGRNALIVIGGIILAYVLSLYGSEPFKVTGKITEGVPHFALPPFQTQVGNQTFNFLDMTKELESSIISVPAIAVLETIAIAKAFAKGKSLDANQEMIALGLCNVFGSFARSMPTAGSFTRTAVNNASGVRTPMGGILTGCLVLLACGLLTSTFKFIPKASLASVIIVAMYYMLELHIFHLLWRTKKIDLIPLCVTVIACLSFGLEYGMIAGITVNLVLLLYLSARPSLVIEEKNVNNLTILFVRPKQSLSFPAAEYLREQVMTWCDRNPEINTIILDGHRVDSIDATVAKNMALLNMDLNMRHQTLIFWNWLEDTQHVLAAYDPSISVHFKSCEKFTHLFTDANNPPEIQTVNHV